MKATTISAQHQKLEGIDMLIHKTSNYFFIIFFVDNISLINCCTVSCSGYIWQGFCGAWKRWNLRMWMPRRRKDQAQCRGQEDPCLWILHGEINWIIKGWIFVEHQGSLKGPQATGSYILSWLLTEWSTGANIDNNKMIILLCEVNNEHNLKILSHF